LDGVRLARSIPDEFHVRVYVVVTLSNEGNYRFKRFTGLKIFASAMNRFKFLNKDGQLILVKGSVPIFVDKSQAARTLKFVRMIHVLPGIEPFGASLKDFAALAFPKDFERHEIQKPSNAWLQRRGANPHKLRRRKYHEKDAIAASAASHCWVASRRGLRTGVLLIGPPVVFEPTCRVPPFRVVVRPVDHTALFVPHVFAVEAYSIAFL
jgi:hypothetical protein